MDNRKVLEQHIRVTNITNLYTDMGDLLDTIEDEHTVVKIINARTGQVRGYMVSQRVLDALLDGENLRQTVYPVDAAQILAQIKELNDEGSPQEAVAYWESLTEDERGMVKEQWETVKSTFEQMAKALQ